MTGPEPFLLPTEAVAFLQGGGVRALVIPNPVAPFANGGEGSAVCCATSCAPSLWRSLSPMAAPFHDAPLRAILEFQQRKDFS